MARKPFQLARHPHTYKNNLRRRYSERRDNRIFNLMETMFYVDDVNVVLLGQVLRCTGRHPGCSAHIGEVRLGEIS